MTPQQRRAAIQRAMSKTLAKMDKLDRDGQAELFRLYQQAADDLIVRFGTLGVDQFGNAQLPIMLEYVNAVLQSLRLSQETIFESAIREGAEFGVEPVASAMVTPRPIPPTAATSAVTAVLEQKQQGGLALSDRLWRVDRGASEVLSREIAAAVARGDSASRAARDYVRRGEAIPSDVAGDARLAGLRNIGEIVNQSIVADDDSALANAKRVFRTEINRAQTLAYVEAHEGIPDVVGYKYNLGANHTVRDICDMHARVNLYGLGSGVYPKAAIKRLYPAHPNTQSFITVVFADDVESKDRVKDKSRVDWLSQQSDNLQNAVLGKKKANYLREGKLKDNMIETPFRVLKKRLAA